MPRKAVTYGTCFTFLSSRLRGPGGYYNIGNLIGLGSGLTLQILSMRAAPEPWAGLGDAVTVYFVGSPGSTALTLAMLVFFCAGELYHRAWMGSDHSPNIKLNRLGDFVSGVGALLLAVSLTFFGDLWLAITSTVLLAGGKFGSALSPAQGWPVRIESAVRRGTTESLKFDVFRMAVVMSRVPAICALLLLLLLLLGLLATAMSGSAFGPGEIQSAILLLCYALWTRADILLGRT